MAKFVIVFVAVLVFHAALVAAKKNQKVLQEDKQKVHQEDKQKVQPEGPQKSRIEEITSQIQAVINDVSASLQSILPDGQQVTDVLSHQSKLFAQNVEDIINKLQIELNKTKGTAGKLLQQISGNVTENINALRQAVGVDFPAKASEIRTNLDNRVKNVAAEFEKLVDVVQPNLEQAGDSVSNFAKGILDDFLKAAENLKTEVNELAQPRRAQRPAKI